MSSFHFKYLNLILKLSLSLAVGLRLKSAFAVWICTALAIVAYLSFCTTVYLHLVNPFSQKAQSSKELWRGGKKLLSHVAEEIITGLMCLSPSHYNGFPNIMSNARSLHLPSRCSMVWAQVCYKTAQSSRTRSIAIIFIVTLDNFIVPQEQSLFVQEIELLQELVQDWGTNLCILQEPAQTSPVFIQSARHNSLTLHSLIQKHNLVCI